MRKVFFILGVLVILSLTVFSAFLGIVNILKIREVENKIKGFEFKVLEKRARRLEVWATAYTSSREECDDTPFITASGKRVFWGVIAADPKFPFGTKIYIPYFQKTFIVLDRGGAIKGNRIDIWMSDKKSAIEFGKRKLEIYILGGEK